MVDELIVFKFIIIFRSLNKIGNYSYILKKYIEVQANIGITQTRHSGVTIGNTLREAITLLIGERLRDEAVAWAP